MYKSPILPDPDKPCYKCKHYNYNSFHNEGCCCLLYYPVDGNGTCEEWESYEE